MLGFQKQIRILHGFAAVSTPKRCACGSNWRFRMRNDAGMISFVTEAGKIRLVDSSLLRGFKLCIRLFYVLLH